MTLQNLTLEVHAGDELLAAVETLKKAAQISPEFAECLSDLLFEGGDSLRHDLVQLSNKTAAGTNGLSVSLDLSERFREIVAAAAAGELELLRSYRVVQVHGGPHAK